MYTIKNKIFNIISENEFIELALEIFNFQLLNNNVYSNWVKILKVNPDKVRTLEQIPFLPIEFFKTKKIISSSLSSETVEFTSSATTSQTPAKHYVNDVLLYQKSFSNCFNLFYGSPADYCILALLPNYLQRKGSSLVYMCNQLINESTHPFSGFFLDNTDDLIFRINELKQTNQKVILIGVSYALIDLCEKGAILNENFIVMETGGMKGTRKEMLKSELHNFLKNGFAVNTIHSEYGMTELLSQAYSKGHGLFESPPWMKFLIREIDDPLKIKIDGRTGGINVIDLANINSCSFIATKDLGKLSHDNKLELMGRYDYSDVRGCNLMMANY